MHGRGRRVRELGVAHVSCLARQAKELVAEAEENNSNIKVRNETWRRWYACGLCEQDYHGVVMCALGWACWKTYVGRPETDKLRRAAMGVLGSGFSAAENYEDALTVREAELATMRRFGASERNILAVQGSLAITYAKLGHLEKALSLHREVYARSELVSPGAANKFLGALNLAGSLSSTGRFEEAKSLLRKVLPEALRTLGPDHDTTLVIRRALVRNVGADPESSLAELRQAEADSAMYAEERVASWGRRIQSQLPARY